MPSKSGMIKQLAAFLQDQRGALVKRVEVAVRREHSPTYGPDSKECDFTEIEVVDLDALFEKIDEFGEKLRGEEREGRFARRGKESHGPKG